jgi:hypothetical protein
MVIKEVAKHVIDTLPEEATMDDIMHALYVNTKFNHGEQEIRNGKGVTHDKAKIRLNKWLK